MGIGYEEENDSFDVCESVMFSIGKTETCVLDLQHHTALIDVLQ